MNKEKVAELEEEVKVPSPKLNELKEFVKSHKTDIQRGLIDENERLKKEVEKLERNNKTLKEVMVFFQLQDGFELLEYPDHSQLKSKEHCSIETYITELLQYKSLYDEAQAEVEKHRQANNQLVEDFAKNIGEYEKYKSLYEESQKELSQLKEGLKEKINWILGFEFLFKNDTKAEKLRAVSIQYLYEWRKELLSTKEEEGEEKEREPGWGLDEKDKVIMKLERQLKDVFVYLQEGCPSYCNGYCPKSVGCDDACSITNCPILNPDKKESQPSGGQVREEKTHCRNCLWWTLSSKKKDIGFCGTYEVHFKGEKTGCKDFKPIHTSAGNKEEEKPTSVTAGNLRSEYNTIKKRIWALEQLVISLEDKLKESDHNGGRVEASKISKVDEGIHTFEEPLYIGAPPASDYISKEKVKEALDKIDSELESLMDEGQIIILGNIIKEWKRKLLSEGEANFENFEQFILRIDKRTNEITTIGNHKMFTEFLIKLVNELTSKTKNVILSGEPIRSLNDVRNEINVCHQKERGLINPDNALLQTLEDCMRTVNELESNKRIDFNIDTKEKFMELLEEVWVAPYGTYRIDSDVLEIHTGGWSENEEALPKLERTMFWGMNWMKSERGGHYYLKIPEQNYPKKIEE